MNPDDINRDIILVTLNQLPNLILPSQIAVSIPIVRRIYSLIVANPNVDIGAIKVDTARNAIGNGHHRYVSYMLANLVPNMDGYTIPQNTPILTWETINFTEDDYDKNYNEFKVSVY